MLNEITNELSVYRAEKMTNLSRDKVTRLVIDAMERVSPGSIQGLMGVDAESDGITGYAWEQAVTSAESVAAVVYGYGAINHAMDLKDATPVTFDDALNYVADRVAESILTLHGYERVGRQNDKVYVVITENKYGYISDLEVMDAEPTFTMVNDSEGTMSLYEANINGGDSRKLR